METQMRFRFIDATPQKDGSVEQVNYYLECSWEDTNNIHVDIFTIPEPNLKLTAETAKHFKEAFTFDFDFEQVNVPDTITKFLHTGFSFEPKEIEIAAEHDRYGFTNCKDEVQNFIIENQSLWEAVEL